MIQIFVKLPGGETTTLNVSDETTIKDIKDEIEKITEIPSASQVLNFGGKIASDEKSITEYGIVECSTFYMHLRLMSCKNCNCVND